MRGKVAYVSRFTRKEPPLSPPPQPLPTPKKQKRKFGKENESYAFMGSIKILILGTLTLDYPGARTRCRGVLDMVA